MDNAIDLHIHSIYSDGSDTPNTIVNLAKKLGLAKSAVTLVSGQTSRDKVVFLPGIAPEQLAAALE